MQELKHKDTSGGSEPRVAVRRASGLALNSAFLAIRNGAGFVAPSRFHPLACHQRIKAAPASSSAAAASRFALIGRTGRPSAP